MRALMSGEISVDTVSQMGYNGTEGGGNMVIFINELGQTQELLLDERETKIQLKAYQGMYEEVKSWENPPENMIKWCKWRIATEEDLRKLEEKNSKERL